MALAFLLALLASTVKAYQFPNGRCEQNACTANPYTVSWVNSSSLCFRVSLKECVETPQNCCQSLTNNLNKFVITANPSCKNQFKGVTVNGVRKGGGVFFDLYDNNTEAELRVTALKSNSTTIQGLEFCIQSDAPCNTQDAFCNGDCRYSSFDPFSHKCCPTCNLLVAARDAAASSPPPSPTPRRPPPPPPPPPRREPPSPPDYPDYPPSVDSVQTICLCNCDC